MTDRIVREGINSSELVNIRLRKVALRAWAQAENLFRRLINVADDFGRFDARTVIVKGNCYPLNLDSIREADMSRWLDYLQKAGLVALYELDGKPYGVLMKWVNKPRAYRSHWPQPPQGVPCWRGLGSANPKQDTREFTIHVKADDNICPQPMTSEGICAQMRPDSGSGSGADTGSGSDSKMRARASRYAGWKNADSDPATRDRQMRFDEVSAAAARIVADSIAEDSAQAMEVRYDTGRSDGGGEVSHDQLAG